MRSAARASSGNRSTEQTGGCAHVAKYQPHDGEFPRGILEPPRTACDGRRFDRCQDAGYRRGKALPGKGRIQAIPIGRRKFNGSGRCLIYEVYFVLHAERISAEMGCLSGTTRTHRQDRRVNRNEQMSIFVNVPSKRPRNGTRSPAATGPASINRAVALTRGSSQKCGVPWYLSCSVCDNMKGQRPRADRSPRTLPGR